MATSGSVDFKSNRLEIIKGAYEICRVIDPTEPLAPSLVQSAAHVLNQMLKSFQTYGMPLWGIKRGTITLTQSTQYYTCGPAGTGLTERPLRIIEAFYRNGTQDTPLQIISREEYWGLGDKSTEGIPNEIYYDPQLNLGVLYVFNPADVNTAGNTIELVYHRPFEDMDADTNDFDFPQEWELAIELGLAALLCRRNGVNAVNSQMIKADATMALNQVIGWDVENVSTFFQPNLSP